MALDNLAAYPGACSGTTKCDFEGNTCDWLPQQDAKMPWINAPATDRVEGGPHEDHTTYTEDGKLNPFNSSGNCNSCSLRIAPD